jgi:Holliday junction resolvase RusA-like endonuclease
MSALMVTVWGTPAPQGSKTARPIYTGRGDAKVFTGKVAQVESSKSRVHMWRQDVVAETRRVIQAASWITMTGPVEVTIHFALARPKSHYRTGRYAHLLRDNAPLYPTHAPDIDKTVRATLDALTTAGVWCDDGQVSHLVATKDFCDELATKHPGAFITISERFS